ncbi:hypothetical protein OPV22_015690 [Ensete ventricosum]|uniref:Retrotransposon gag domain-containing protein n=1 Tax=Ensete ventricosum TaxID=4639 RepID=A0AAV8PTI0_ENSVE|nr:hypothetical protein OPV22_015690 [Ensete ventricosum]
MVKHRGESSKMGQAGPLLHAAAGGLQVQTRSQTAGAAYEECNSEQDEREVGYSPRWEEAPSGAPTGKKGHRERLTMAETRLDVLEASVEELYQGQGRLLGVESSQEEAEARTEKVESLIDQLTEDTKDFVRHLHEVVAELTAKVMVLTRTLDAGGSNTRVAPPQHFRAPEPQCYGGARDAKELENFLFDMEQYFCATRLDSEETKVAIATMYLNGDAKLWWRTRWEEIQQGRCRVDTWGDLKRELRTRFLPENTEFVARRKLRQLRQSTTIRDYVKQFSALMLDIWDMSEKDKLFSFLDGLKPWAQQELHRRNVTDVVGAIAAAERLTDFVSSEDLRKKKHSSGNRPSKYSRAKESGGEQKKKNFHKGPGSRGRVPKSSGCFLCGGPHKVRECPQKQALNALTASILPRKLDKGKAIALSSSSSDSSSDSEASQGTRMGAMRLLNALRGPSGGEHKGKATKGRKQRVDVCGHQA